MHIFNNIIWRFRWFSVHSNDHYKGFHNVVYVYEQNNGYGAFKNPGFAENSTIHVTVTRRKYFHAKFVAKYSQDQKELNYLNGNFSHSELCLTFNDIKVEILVHELRSDV